MVLRFRGSGVPKFGFPVTAESFRRSAALLGFVVIAFAATVFGQSSSGLIIGRVTDGLTNRSLQGVTIALTGVGPAVRVLVDSQGRFMFRNVPKGHYSLTASK